MCIQVAKLAEALPVADAYGRAGVGPYAQVGAYTEVAKKRLVSEALSGSANDACELGFAGAQCDGGSRGGPMLKAWLPSNTHPPEVLFRVFGQPAQSVSVYTSTSSTSCCGYVYTNLGAPAK